VATPPPRGTPTTINAFFSLKTKPAASAVSTAPRPPAGTGTSDPTPPPHFASVSSSFFSYEQQAVKGVRANCDVGQPVDAARPFVGGIQNGAASCGSWGCTEGGWLSPKPRTSTEWFFVLAGRGSVSAPSTGETFSFGPGDLVVLPKGWSGRWDVTHRIHKIWVVHKHEDVAGGAAVDPVVVTARALSGGNLVAYDVGSTRAGSWCSTKCSINITPRQVAEVFVVTKGTMFITNSDGSARRCGVGDVVHLPEAWNGSIDVVDFVRTAFVEIAGPNFSVGGDLETKYRDGGGMTQSSGQTHRASNPERGAIYQVGPPVPVPVWGHRAASRSAQPSQSSQPHVSDKSKYDLCLTILETSKDQDLLAVAKAKLLAYLE